MAVRLVPGLPEEGEAPVSAAQGAVFSRTASKFDARLSWGWSCWRKRCTGVRLGFDTEDAAAASLREHHDADCERVVDDDGF